MFPFKKKSNDVQNQANDNNINSLNETLTGEKSNRNNETPSYPNLRDVSKFGDFKVNLLEKETSDDTSNKENNVKDIILRTKSKREKKKYPPVKNLEKGKETRISMFPKAHQSWQNLSLLEEYETKQQLKRISTDKGSASLENCQKVLNSDKKEYILMDVAANQVSNQKEVENKMNDIQNEIKILRECYSQLISKIENLEKKDQERDKKMNAMETQIEKCTCANTDSLISELKTIQKEQISDNVQNITATEDIDHNENNEKKEFRDVEKSKNRTLTYYRNSKDSSKEKIRTNEKDAIEKEDRKVEDDGIETEKSNYLEIDNSIKISNDEIDKSIFQNLTLRDEIEKRNILEPRTESNLEYENTMSKYEEDWDKAFATDYWLNTNMAELPEWSFEISEITGDEDPIENMDFFLSTLFEENTQDKSYPQPLKISDSKSDFEKDKKIEYDEKKVETENFQTECKLETGSTGNDENEEGHDLNIIEKLTENTEDDKNLQKFEEGECFDSKEASENDNKDDITRISSELNLLEGSKPKYVCDQCGSIFHSEETLNKHMKDELEASYEVGENIKNTRNLEQKSMNDLDQHLKGNLMKEKDEVEKQITLKHQLLKETQENHVCSECGLILFTKVALHNHIIKKHKKTQTSYVCNLCGCDVQIIHKNNHDKNSCKKKQGNQKRTTRNNFF